MNQITKKYLLFVIGFLFTTIVYSQNIKLIKYKDFEALKHQNNDTLYIVNFWATWCKPCVDELPIFQTIAQQNKDRKVKIIAISLDFVKELPKLKEFTTEHQYSFDVWLFTENMNNIIIDKVSGLWQGSIPATIIIYPKMNVYDFYKEGSITQKELEHKINHYLQ